MRRPKRKREPFGETDSTPHQLPDGRWQGCGHNVPHREPPWVGWDPRRANPYVPHRHDYEEGEAENE